MRRLSFAVVAATLIVLMHQGGIPAASAGVGGTGTVSYLALGDSVAFGFQPGKGKTNGYVGRVWRDRRQEIPGLSLRNVSCIGETSRSMITGERSSCHYAAGSQLDAAVSFLEAHPGEVAFITIDIGGNDLIARCLDWNTGLLERACVVDQRPRLQTRLRRIVDALTAAAPGVPIVAMTYYNPLLGLWGLVPGGRPLARADQRAWAVFNAGLASAYADAGATVADVASAFRIDDFTDTVVVRGRGRIPVNVALACKLTWFCSTRFTADVHPNWKGYRKIARTFNRELQVLLP
jgi:lysophospholipase L1-like esterase